MNIQQLIDKLQAIPDKSIQVKVYSDLNNQWVEAEDINTGFFDTWDNAKEEVRIN